MTSGAGIQSLEVTRRAPFIVLAAQRTERHHALPIRFHMPTSIWLICVGVGISLRCDGSYYN